MRSFINLICILCLLSFMPIKQARQTVVFEVQLPTDHLPVATDQLYLAGDFNGWHTADSAYCFKLDRKGHYVLRTRLTVGSHAFKVVRGSWQTVESDRLGGAIANRTLDVQKQSGRSPLKISIQIAGWSDDFPREPAKSTAASNVQLLDSAFYIPQLDRKRRIWIYLPKLYGQETDRHYPVIYMQDGQNVFDEATAFSGEWGIDEYLNGLSADKQCIVIAVDNGGNERMQEYNPYNNKQFGKQEGKAFAAFMAETLKPYVDAHYRTKPDPAHTTVCGSSMGGLISFYIAINYPSVFGRAGVFSPSFWIAPEIYAAAQKALPDLATSDFYFYGGSKEGDSLATRLEQMKAILDQNRILPEYNKLIMDPEGAHQEKYWREAFGPFYQWLLSLPERSVH